MIYAYYKTPNQPLIQEISRTVHTELVLQGRETEQSTHPFKGKLKFELKDPVRTAL